MLPEECEYQKYRLIIQRIEYAFTDRQECAAKRPRTPRCGDGNPGFSRAVDHVEDVAPTFRSAHAGLKRLQKNPWRCHPERREGPVRSFSGRAMEANYGGSSPQKRVHNDSATRFSAACKARRAASCQPVRPDGKAATPKARGSGRPCRCGPLHLFLGAPPASHSPARARALSRRGT